MISFLFAALISAHAAPVVTSYNCRVAIFAEDIPGGVMQTNFSRPVQAKGAHGGAAQTFTSGDHTVAIMADGKWRGITWQHKGKAIAVTVSAAADIISGSAALIVYNPANEEEQVHLSCEPLPGHFPNE